MKLMLLVLMLGLCCLGCEPGEDTGDPGEQVEQGAGGGSKIPVTVCFERPGNVCPKGEQP